MKHLIILLFLAALPVAAQVTCVGCASGGSGGDYTLPVAAPSVLGGVKVGTNLSIDEAGILSASGGSGNMAVTSVTADPSGACTAGQQWWLRTDVSPPTLWFCGVSGTPQKVMSTTNSGPFSIIGAVGSALSTPAAGEMGLWFDSTSLTLYAINESGVKSTTVVPVASRVANQFMTHIPGTGIAATAAIASADLPANNRIRSFGASFDGGGSALTARQSLPIVVPYACTISAWNILADSGTATIKLWKVATGTAIPTISNVINTSGLSLSTGTAVHSTTLSDFTTGATTVSANDIIIFAVTAVSTATKLVVSIQCDL